MAQSRTVIPSSTAGADAPYDDLEQFWLHLQHADFEVSTRRQITVARWLLQRAATLSTPSEQHWAVELAPLICRNSDEQQRYRDVVDTWLQKPNNPQERLQAVKPKPATKPHSDKPIVDKPWKWVLALPILASLLLALFGTVWFSSDYCNVVAPQVLCEIFHPTKEKPIDPGPGSPGGTSDPDSGTRNTALAVPVAQPLPILDLAQISRIGPQAVHWLERSFWALLPLLLCTGALIWLWRRRSAVMQRDLKDERESQQQDALRLRGSQSLFADGTVDQAMRSLNRRVEVGRSSDLDLAASIHSTAQTGYAKLHYQPLQRLPETIVLVQVSGGADLRHELATQLLRKLRRNGLRAHGYSFQRSPQRLVALLRGGQVHSLAQLQRLHPHAHVLLMTDPHRLFDHYGESLLQWAAQLGRWAPSAPLLSSEPFSAELVQQMARHKLRLLPLNALGLAQLTGPAVSSGSSPAVLPLALQGDDWPDSPPDQQLQLEKLKNYLGEQGMTVFSAVAAYPELHLGLCLALDQQLYPEQQEPDRQRRLLDILRLPWGRHGWLPDTLRENLIDQQSVAQLSNTRAAYRGLFESLGASGALQLPFYHRDHWTRLRWFLGLRGEGSRDAVFLSLVVGSPWLNRLSFMMPKWGRALARLGMHHRLLGSAALMCAAGVSALLYINSPELFMGPADTGISAQIRSVESQRARAATLEDWLQRSGVPTDVVVVEQLDPGIALNVTPARDALAQGLADALRRMPDATSVQVTLDGDSPDLIALQVGEPSAPLTPVFRDFIPSTAKGKAQPTDYTLPKMIPIVAGTFLMGSPVTEANRSDDEGPQHPVNIAAFELAENEVTFDEYAQYVAGSGNKGAPVQMPDDEGWGRGQRPVINVSWQDAQAYVQWLNSKSGGNYRLPTEAEWEYAARAGTTSPFYSGGCIDSAQVNYDGNYPYSNCRDSGIYREQTVPVHELRDVNGWGLRHMAGNVYEWTQDCWHSDYTGAPSDGRAWLGESGGDCIAVCCAAARGSTSRRSCGPRTASGTPPTSASSTLDFVSPGHLSLWRLIFDALRFESLCCAGGACVLF